MSSIGGLVIFLVITLVRHFIIPGNFGGRFFRVRDQHAHMRTFICHLMIIGLLETSQDELSVLN